jgi:hypothetical protein
MAGFFADAPGPQIMYDRDGSRAFHVVAGGTTGTLLTAAQAKDLLDISGGTGYTAANLQSGGVYYAVIFPELRTLVGYFIVHDSGTTGGNSINVQNLQSSTDSTNGYDGIWTTVTASPTWTTSVNGFRTVTAQAVSSVKAVRINPYQTGGAAGGSSNLLAFMLYGGPVTPTERLRIWHPTLDQELGGAGFDYGDAPRSATYNKTFRVKNTSTARTANSIVLSAEALPTEASPTVVSQLTISQGSGFASTQTITSLAAGTISAVCTLRLTLLSTAALGLFRQRVLAVPTSWT